MVVNVSIGESFTADTPRVLVAGDIFTQGVAPGYDVSLDATRALLMKRGVSDQPGYPLVVVQNWFTELEHDLRR
jgi:hypothetical protein